VLKSAESVEVDGNTIEGSLEAGLGITSSSTGSTITDNQILGSYGDGLAQDFGSSGTTATGNTILGLTLDVCNEGGFVTFSGNTFVTGGVSAICRVF